MNATNSSRRDHGRPANQDAEHEHAAHDHLEHGQQMTHGHGGVSGQQLVGADRGDALIGVRQLDGAGVDPHAADDEARGQPRPFLHVA